MIAALLDRAQPSAKSLDERVVTVCSGLDLVNISYTNFVASTPEIASVGHFSCLLLLENVLIKKVS